MIRKMIDNIGTPLEISMAILFASSVTLLCVGLFGEDAKELLEKINEKNRSK